MTSRAMHSSKTIKGDFDNKDLNGNSLSLTPDNSCGYLSKLSNKDLDLEYF